MITPVVGRIVWYWPEGKKEGVQPLAAKISYVWSDEMINIGYLDPNGVAHATTSVTLFQGEGSEPETRFCEWMPYQKGQAAKTEALEKIFT